MKITIEVDRITIDGSQTPSAEQIEELIRRLILVRSGMHPAVPKKLPTEASPEMQVLIEDQPDLSIAARSGGGFRLWVRHSGIGWLGFQLDGKTAAGMARFITNHTGGIEPIDLINHSGGQRH